jgi:hypothetical protein
LIFRRAIRTPQDILQITDGVVLANASNIAAAQPPKGD